MAMPVLDYEAQIAAFIRAKGVTRCPTACAAPTQAAASATDRAILREHADRREAVRDQKVRNFWRPNLPPLSAAAL